MHTTCTTIEARNKMACVLFHVSFLLYNYSDVVFIGYSTVVVSTSILGSCSERRNS